MSHLLADRLRDFDGLCNGDEKGTLEDAKGRFVKISLVINTRLLCCGVPLDTWTLPPSRARRRYLKIH